MRGAEADSIPKDHQSRLHFNKYTSANTLQQIHLKKNTLEENTLSENISRLGGPRTLCNGAETPTQ